MSKKTLRRKFLFENKAFDGKTLKGCNCKNNDTVYISCTEYTEDLD